MTEKELKKQVLHTSKSSGRFLVLQVIFDLLPQVLLVYLIKLLMETPHDFLPMLTVIALMLGSFSLKEVFYYLSTKLAHKDAYGKLSELRLQIIERLKSLNLGFFKAHNTGELTNIIEHDVEQIEIYLAHGLPEILAVTIFPIAIFCLMLWIDYRLALLMVLGVPLMYLIKKLSQGVMTRNFALYFQQETKMREDLMEYVANISVIKAFAKEEDMSERTLTSARGYTDWAVKSMGAITIPMGLIDLSMELGSALVMIVGGLLLMMQSISVSNYILSIILSAAFTASISKTATLQHFSIVFSEAIKSIGKILLIGQPEARKQGRLDAGDIRFDNVGFDYGEDRFRLENIRLTLKEGSVNAFVGASGCGKSTIANLLMGFWDPSEGSIWVGQQRLSEYSQESIAHLIGSVQQDVILFNQSIHENIALGKPNATRDEVITAARKAQIHEFIISLPKGYDTQVGEMGVKLSGGEKQRISIARMILKDAPILILDEAMAAVDSENERKIQAAIEELSKGKTVITIAHHLNTITNSDQIIVMDQGKVLATGTHGTLLEICPLYRKMVAAQNKVDQWDLKQEVTSFV